MSDITRTGLALPVSSSDSVAGFAIDSNTTTDRMTFADLPGSSGAAESQRQGVRMDLVMRIRAQIAAGTYETSEKLDAAIERMLAGGR